MPSQKTNYLSELDELPKMDAETTGNDNAGKPIRKPFNHAIKTEYIDFMARVARKHGMKANAALEKVIEFYRANSGKEYPPLTEYED